MDLSIKTRNEIKAFSAPYVEALNQCGSAFLSPVWAVKEIMGTIYSSQKQLYFQEFIEGIAYDFASKSIDTQEVELLAKKVSDSKNYETMTSILDTVFFSRSKVSRMILGVIAGKTMRDNKLDYEDMVLVTALKDVLDNDLNRFQFYLNSMLNTDENYSFITEYSETDRLIVEKLQNAGVLGRDLAGNRLGGPSLRFERTSVSKRLKEYLDVFQPMFVDA